MGNEECVDAVEFVDPPFVAFADIPDEATFTAAARDGKGRPAVEGDVRILADNPWLGYRVLYVYDDEGRYWGQQWIINVQREHHTPTCRWDGDS